MSSESREERRVFFIYPNSLEELAELIRFHGHRVPRTSFFIYFWLRDNGPTYIEELYRAYLRFLDEYSIRVRRPKYSSFRVMINRLRRLGLVENDRIEPPPREHLANRVYIRLTSAGMNLRHPGWINPHGAPDELYIVGGGEPAISTQPSVERPETEKKEKKKKKARKTKKKKEKRKKTVKRKEIKEELKEKFVSEEEYEAYKERLRKIKGKYHALIIDTIDKVSNVFKTTVPEKEYAKVTPEIIMGKICSGYLTNVDVYALAYNDFGYEKFEEIIKMIYSKALKDSVYEALLREFLRWVSEHNDIIAYKYIGMLINYGEETEMNLAEFDVWFMLEGVMMDYGIDENYVDDVCRGGGK